MTFKLTRLAFKFKDKQFDIFVINFYKKRETNIAQIEVEKIGYKSIYLRF